ncbi:MAG: HIT family hydrolase [Verrucomicrobia bacterium]|nr:MAG: HIT family hydrolase [Verrucomicrobiota bacterium]
MDFPKIELETLWAPWRFEYFAKSGSHDFLSEAARTSDDRAHLVVTRVGGLGALGENEITELFSLVVHGQNILREVVKAQGFNIGINIGECAGAGVPDHLHIHIVPRWSGDTNFMPMLSATRVISESLQSLYEKLMAARSTDWNDEQ